MLWERRKYLYQEESNMKKYFAPDFYFVECNLEHIIATSFDTPDNPEDNVVAGAPERREWSEDGLWDRRMW